MFDWVANTVSSLAQWAHWLGKENGPAVGRKSQRTWRGLVFLGRVQFWAVVTLIVGLVLWLTYVAEKLASVPGTLVALAGLAAYGHRHFDDTSAVGTLRLFVIVFAVILVVTLGRPALMFDLQGDTDEASDENRDAARIARTQVAVIATVVLLVVVYFVGGFTFLD